MYEFKLPSSVTISSCDELRRKAVEVKSNNEKIQLNSCDVDTVDTAGIQFIHALCLDENQVTHTTMSETVKNAMSELGLAGI